MAYDNPEDTLVLETTKGQVVIKLRPDLAEPYFLLAKGVYDRGEDRQGWDLIARSIPYLIKCLDIDPKHGRAQRKLNAALKALKAHGDIPAPDSVLPAFAADSHKGSDPIRFSVLCQVKRNSADTPGGKPIFDGVWTRWYESGMLAEFREYRDGKPHGTRVTWDPDGTEISKQRFANGELVDE